jgi:hypothetical protein
VEPSRDTQGRRARELRAKARQLEETLGPDQSLIVFDYGDGWTVRHITTLADQHREGTLMRHCLRTVTTPDQNAWSLRDPDNLPHLTFAAWHIEPTDDLTEVPIDDPIHRAFVFVRAGSALLFIDLSRPLKGERRAQLQTFGNRCNTAEVLDRFPTGSVARLHTIMANLNFDAATQPIADRVAARYAELATT